MLSLTCCQAAYHSTSGPSLADPDVTRLALAPTAMTAGLYRHPGTLRRSPLRAADPNDPSLLVAEVWFGLQYANGDRSESTTFSKFEYFVSLPGLRR